MQNTKNLLSIVDLKKYFPLPKRSFFQRQRPYLRANDGITLDIKKGETFGLVGESGCGKSTLGRTLLQLIRPTGGEVIYYGKNLEEFAPKYMKNTQTTGAGIDLTKLTGEEMRRLRRDLQIVFQDPYSSLNPRMTMGQIIEEGVATHRFFKRGSNEMKEYVADVVKKCGLQAHMLHRYPHQFSGGQRQRICIARALAVKPKFVVCDECVSALDVSVQSQILNLLTELKEKEGLTYLFISHDLSVVRYISDRIAVMYRGKIVEIGRAADVFDNARHPYTIALIAAVPSIGKGGKIGGDIPLKEGGKGEENDALGCPFYPRCFMGKKECQRIPAPYVEVEKEHFVACHYAHVSTDEKCSLAKRKN